MSLRRFGMGISLFIAGLLGACVADGTSTSTAAVVDPPPHAAFSVVCTGKTCSADSEGSSDDGFLTNFSWAWGDGATTSGGSSASAPSHTYAGFGSFTITLTVTDNAGGTNSVSHGVTLVQGPTVSFDPKCSGLFCIGDAVLTTGPAPIVNYHWDWDDETTTDSADNVVTHQFTSAGTFRIHLSVTDANGQEAGVTHAVTLPAALIDPPPHAAFSVVCIGNTCSADSEASSDDGFLTNFSWAWGDGATTSGGSSASAPSHTYAGFGPFTITLTVTDNAGGTNSVSHGVTLVQGPTASFDPKCSGLFCIGDAVLTSGPAPIVSYHWDWDDETTTDSGDNVVIHQFASAGTFRIHLSVTDANGQEAGVTHTVTLPFVF